MDPQTVREKFQSEIDVIKNSAICKAFSWEIQVELEKFLTYVEMCSRKAKEKKFLLRIIFDDYPQRAPSYVFVDINTKEEKAEVWPPNLRHPGPPPGICTLGTREFYENLHKNEQAYQWDSNKFKIISTLQNIQILIDRPK